MDYVKREHQDVIDEDNYKVYMDNLQRSHQIDTTEYQHTQISMEQLHQAMQSSLNGSLVHNFQLPLSPRQMSTLMLKTNLHNFNEIPAHFRNLELNFAQTLSDQNLTQNVNQIRNIESLNRNLDISLVRSLGNEIDLQNGLSQNITEDLRLNDIQISQIRSNDLQMSQIRSNELQMSQIRSNELQMSQIRSELPHDLSHEMDLSQLNRQNLEQEILQDEARRMVIQCVPDSSLLEQNMVHIGQRLDQVGQRAEPRLVSIVHERQVTHSGLPLQFHIKAEQEDDTYFYDNINQINVNGINGHLPAEQTQAHTNAQTDTQMFSIYPPQNIPALNPIDLYARVQNYPQNFVSRENPQNLVVHRQYENASPYQEEFKNDEDSKTEEPKENLKPNDNKMIYNEFPSGSDKEDSTSKTDGLAMSIKGEYVCYRCNEICPSKRILKQHAKSCLGKEDGERVGKFGCSQCSYRCQSPAILKIHERTHSGEKPFSCNFCDYKSGQKNNVAKHILVHMKEKPFRCQYCEYRCAQKNNLVVHERTHTGFKPFACPYCEYRTVQKPNLVKHMYLHTDQKPFSCDMCTYKCVQKTNLTKHKQRHLHDNGTEKALLPDKIKPYRPRQKSLKCPSCHYRCVQKSSMEKHMHFKHNIEFVNMETDEYVQNLSVKKDFVDEKVCEISESEVQS